MTQTEVELLPLDTTDVDTWMGRPVGGQPAERTGSDDGHPALGAGMQNPNPLYYDEDFAAKRARADRRAAVVHRLPAIVGHGATPAIQGTHPRLAHALRRRRMVVLRAPHPPGRQGAQRALAFDYSVTNTSLRRPDDVPARRHDLREPARRAGRQAALDLDPLPGRRTRTGSHSFADSEEPIWTDEELERVEREKLDYYMSFHGHVAEPVNDVTEGQELPQGRARAAHAQSLTPSGARIMFTVWGVARVRRRRDLDRERRLAAGDDGRPEGGRDRPGAGGRPLLRRLARPRQRPLREADRDAAGVRLRRVDGRLGARLRRPTGPARRASSRTATSSTATRPSGRRDVPRPAPSRTSATTR